MRRIFKSEATKLLTIFCFCFGLIHIPAAEFVEISAEIESLGYRLNDTNSITRAKPKTTRVVCITGAKTWFLSNDFAEQPEQWLFDSTNVWCKTERRSATGEKTFHVKDWPSNDGHPMGHFGVNIPWLAFCSGTYLKREGRMIPLPAAILRHCPDRFAYRDMTTTFADREGLPRTLDLFSSQALFLKSHTDWDKEHSFGDRYTEWNKTTAPKIQDDVLVFHYAIVESTNVLGKNFPLRFEFFQCGRQYEQDGNWYCQGTGRVLSIRPSVGLPSLK
jgi:hypothetical protein